jgi:hypothetical protein
LINYSKTRKNKFFPLLDTKIKNKKINDCIRICVQRELSQ